MFIFSNLYDCKGGAGCASEGLDGWEKDQFLEFFRDEDRYNLALTA
jgi:hypothetical protein